MGIKLSWLSQASYGLDAIEVYRSAAGPISQSSPGTPIATLSGNATSYEDTTVQNKNLYYYALAAVKGSDRAVGLSKLMGYFSETGPGRSTPLRGDWKSGYMDMLSINDFITPASLFAKMPTASSFVKLTTMTYWYKMCFNGKVLFIPNAPLFSGAGWQTLYNAGLVFGTNDNGTVPATSGMAGKNTVNQYRPIQIGDLTYIPRCPSMSSLPLTSYNAATWTDQTAEFRSTITRMYTPTIENNSAYNTRFGQVAVDMSYFVGQNFINTTQIPYSAHGNVIGWDYNNNFLAGYGSNLGIILELVMP